MLALTALFAPLLRRALVDNVCPPPARVIPLPCIVSELTLAGAVIVVVPLVRRELPSLSAPPPVGLPPLYSPAVSCRSPLAPLVAKLVTPLVPSVIVA